MLIFVVAAYASGGCDDKTKTHNTMKTKYSRLARGAASVCLASLMLASCASPVTRLQKWAATPADGRQEIALQKFANKALSEKEAAAAIDLLYPMWLEELRTEYAPSWNNKVFRSGDLAMRFDYKVFGEKPADGRSLYISLHGGGNTTPEVNDQQQRNQLMLYRPAEGVYVAPRAPWDDWDMWFKPAIDELYDMVIRTAVATEGVNPNKVYLLGYSAGGDGLYRLAPRMADCWAAASMMAGHPGDVSMVNLRNLPFMIWMGENDAAYNRNKLAAVYGAKLDSLQKGDPAGYIHQTHIVKGKGHWMDREDHAAMPWMAQFTRNPYPATIVWRQEEVMHPSFYWLSVPAGDAARGMEVRATIEGNTVTITKNDYRELTLHFNDSMLDLDKPVVVVSDGKIVFEGTLPRTIENIADSWRSRMDINYVFPAKLTLTAGNLAR